MASNDVLEFIQTENEKYSIVIWSKTHCPYCTQAKQLFLSKVSIPPENIKVYELDQMSNGSVIQDQLHALTKQRTVPNIFINNQHVGGNDTVQSLYRNGKLQTMIQQAS